MARTSRRRRARARHAVHIDDDLGPPEEGSNASEALAREGQRTDADGDGLVETGHDPLTDVGTGRAPGAGNGGPDGFGARGDEGSTEAPAAGGDAPAPKLADVARRAGVSSGTVRRWLKGGLVPEYEGRWSANAVAQVRIIARLRARGYTLEQIRSANESGQLAGYVQGMFAPPEGRYSLEQAAEAAGVEEALIERVYMSLGLSSLSLDALSDEDVEMLRYIAAILEAGLPEQVFMQIVRVAGQSLAQIADALVRLIHMYVHEPLMREGVPGTQIAEQMGGLAKEGLPFVAPLMNYVHGRFLAHFVEQDVIGHMEAELDGSAPEEGRMRIVIAFADLAGYTRLTEERGDEEAVGAVERFVEAVEQTLPIDARVIKTLGDEVMVVGSDPVALTQWAVGFQMETPEDQPAPRIGVHFGEALYRDGDYYGRDVNQAARVVARAAGGEVLVTRAVVDMATGADGLHFELIGEIGLKGFSEPTELFHALARG